MELRKKLQNYGEISFTWYEQIFKSEAIYSKREENVMAYSVRQ